MSAAANASDFWKLDGRSAALDAGPLHATIDLAHPELGLRVVRDGSVIVKAMLAVCAIDARGDEPWQPGDAYGRGDDLAVAYEATNARPFRVHIYWRLCRDESKLIDGLVVDAIVSLQTRLWEAYPKVAVGSTLRAESIAAVDATGNVDLTAPAELAAKRVEYPSGVATLLRLADGDSYCEARTANDFDFWRATPTESAEIRTESVYASKFMERGVIRRITLRAAVGPRTGDVDTARAIRRRLALERPTLTA